MRTLFKIVKIITLIGMIIFGVKLFTEKNNKTNDKVAKPASHDVKEINISQPKSKVQRELPVRIKRNSEILSLNDRQSQLLRVLKQKGNIEMKDLKLQFPNVTERTLRRDFNKLSEHGFVSKKGSTKATVYYYKS